VKSKPQQWGGRGPSRAVRTHGKKNNVEESGRTFLATHFGICMDTMKKTPRPNFHPG